MYIDKKVTMWVRDHYDDSISLGELKDDIDSEKGFIERENLYETEEYVYDNEDSEYPIFEIFSDNGEVLYSSIR